MASKNIQPNRGRYVDSNLEKVEEIRNIKRLPREWVVGFHAAVNEMKLDERHVSQSHSRAPKIRIQTDVVGIKNGSYSKGL